MLALGAVGALLVVFLVDAQWPRDSYFLERQGNAVMEINPPAGDSNRDGLILRGDTGLSVRVRVLRPARQDAPLRTLIILGGYRTGSDAVDVAGDLEEVAIVALDYPYDGALKFDNIIDLARALPVIRRALLDTPPSIFLALSWLEKQPWADPHRQELVGVSLGVPFAATAAALDARVDRLWLVHGAADNYVWLKANVDRWAWRPWVKAVLARLLFWFAYAPSFDTAERVKAVAPRAVTIIGAREDERMPQGQTEALFAAAAMPKRLLWTEGQHVETDREDIVRTLISLVVANNEAG